LFADHVEAFFTVRVLGTGKGGSQSYVSKQWRQAQVDIPEVGRKGWCVCVPVAPAASFLSGSFDMHPARVMSTAEKEGKEGEEGKEKKKKKKKFLLLLFLLLFTLDAGNGREYADTRIVPCEEAGKAASVMIYWCPCHTPATSQKKRKRKEKKVIGNYGYGYGMENNDNKVGSLSKQQ